MCIRDRAMAANRRQGEHYSANTQQQDDLKNDTTYVSSKQDSQDHHASSVNARKRANAANTNIAETETKKRKRRVATTSVSPNTISTTTSVNNGRVGTSTVSRSVGSIGSSNNSSISRPKTNDYGEPLYCYCNQVAYGEMVGCDGADCELEWFHLPCIGLETLPKGKWYCDDCKKKL